MNSQVFLIRYFMLNLYIWAGYVIYFNTVNKSDKAISNMITLPVKLERLKLRL